MKLIVAGSRDFQDKDMLWAALDDYKGITQIVSGMSRGADYLGFQYATQHGIPVEKYIPDWENIGRSAGHVRNRQMGDYADELIAFWDGKSPGTKGMIDYMKKLGKPVKVVYY